MTSFLAPEIQSTTTGTSPNKITEWAEKGTGEFKRKPVSQFSGWGVGCGVWGLWGVGFVGCGVYGVWGGK